MVVIAGLVKESGQVMMGRTFEKMVSGLLFMWFSYLAARTGSTKKQVHDYYCSLFLDENTSSTKEMTNYQLTDFMHQIQADALVEFGVRLPVPEDGDSYHYFLHEYKNR